MKPPLGIYPLVSRPQRARVALAVVALVTAFSVTGCGSTRTATKTVTVTGSESPANRFGPPSELAQFGHIVSLKRNGNGYGMRFDPEWFLSGETANVAATEDGVVPRG